MTFEADLDVIWKGCSSGEHSVNPLAADQTHEIRCTDRPYADEDKASEKKESMRHTLNQVLWRASIAAEQGLLTRITLQRINPGRRSKWVGLGMWHGLQQVENQRLWRESLAMLLIVLGVGIAIMTCQLLAATR